MSDEKFTVEYANDDGWTDWIAPEASYLMKCCDCGLVHEFEFTIGDSDTGRKNVPIFRAKRVD